MPFTSLVRRGSQYASDHFANNPDKKPEITASPWLIALLAVTVITLMLALWAVEYTYGMVVSSLAAVEDSTPAIYVRIDNDPDPNKPADSAEPEGAAPAKPITSSMRSTVRHLRSRAGPWSRFRGLSLFLVYSFADGLISLMFSGFSGNYFLTQFVVQIVVGVILAPLQLAWVHIIISEPSPKRFYQRIPGRKAWAKIAPVAAFEHALTGLGFYLPMAVAMSLGGWEAFNSSPDMPTAKSTCHALAVVAGPSILGFLVSIPARAVFVRVAASMLPEEDEAIIPFDRSFGGKVVPSILGGSGKLGIVDAWRTFDRAALFRYLKVLGKVFAIEFALVFGFTLAFVAELYAIGGDAVHKMTGNMVQQAD